MASQALRTLGAAREYLVSPHVLRGGEHRKLSRDVYAFDVLARHEPESAGQP
jgi:hypothetical protein